MEETYCIRRGVTLSLFSVKYRDWRGTLY